MPSRSNPRQPASAVTGTRIGPIVIGDSLDAIRDALSRVLDAAGLDYDQRVEVIGGLMVSEAVRPFWEAGHSAEGAHDMLRSRDAELADAIEALSPMLLGRATARDEANDALLAIRELLSAS